MDKKDKKKESQSKIKSDKSKTKTQKKEEKVEVRAMKREAKLQKQYSKVKDGNKFKKWRNKRPFWGATLTVLASLIILYIPLHLYAIAFIPGSLVFVGFLFGGLTLIIGVLGYIYPQFSTVFGVITLFLSVLSVMGALGGFLIGTIMGIIGGSLCIAWNEEEVDLNTNDQSKVRKKKEPKMMVDDKSTNGVQM